MYEVSIMFILKPGKENSRKLETNILYEHIFKILFKNIESPAKYKVIKYRKQLGFIPRLQSTFNIENKLV